MAEIVRMPKMSDTMTEGVVAKWHKKVGDKVKSGDLLADIETDKSTVGYEIQESGFVAKILQKGTGVVALGDPIAIVVDDKNDIAAFANYTGPLAQTAQSTPTQTIAPAQSTSNNTSSTTNSSTTQSNKGGRVFITPLAKNTLLEKGIDLS